MSDDDFESEYLKPLPFVPRALPAAPFPQHTTTLVPSKSPQAGQPMRVREHLHHLPVELMRDGTTGRMVVHALVPAREIVEAAKVDFHDAAPTHVDLADLLEHLWRNEPQTMLDAFEATRSVNGVFEHLSLLDAVIRQTLEANCALIVQSGRQMEAMEKLYPRGPKPDNVDQIEERRVLSRRPKRAIVDARGRPLLGHVTTDSAAAAGGGTADEDQQIEEGDQEHPRGRGKGLYR